MNKIVRCRCGHQVMAREVLRTDLYERASGRDYIYLKFRCMRCKRLGQTFIPEARFDWSSLESGADEMTTQERDRALEAGPISTGELMEFHAALKAVGSVDQLQVSESTPQKLSAVSENETNEQTDKPVAPSARFARSPRRRQRKSDNRQSDNRSRERGDNGRNDNARGDNADDEQNAANGSGDDGNLT